MSEAGWRRPGLGGDYAVSATVATLQRKPQWSIHSYVRLRRAVTVPVRKDNDSKEHAMQIRLGLLAVPLLILATTGDASAQNYPWCAQYSFRGGARNCGFSTYAQCMATVSGVGGFCEQNAMYRPEYMSQPRRKVRRHRH